MPTKFLLHKVAGHVGMADLPSFVDFDEKPPRSFDIYRCDVGRFVRTQTDYYVEITKEVFDIMRSV